MRSDRIFTVVVWILIVLAGLGAAYLCFGILHSQADEKLAQYSVGGAIAGALISWGVLLSIYLQLQNSGDNIRDLRRENEDLKHKLIRGAPRPQGYDIEVDERQRIVLARPREWQPKGGVIFQLELAQRNPPDDNADNRPVDNFAAAFRCSFVPIEKDSDQTKEWFHKRSIDGYNDGVKWGYVQSYSKELTRVGGDAASVESLKVIARQFARVETREGPSKLRPERTWYPVAWAEFVGWIQSAYPYSIASGTPVPITLQGTGFHKGAKCYVNKKERETTVSTPYSAEVILDAEDVLRPGSLEIHIENPETDKRPSNSVWVTVNYPVKPWYPPSDSPIAPSASTDAKGTQSEAAPQTIFSILPPVEPKAATQTDSKADTQKPAEEAQPDANTESQQAANTAKTAAAASAKPDVITTVYVEIITMTVVCYHEELGKVFYFEFVDDANDFLKSSDEFNRILDSTRFLS